MSLAELTQLGFTKEEIMERLIDKAYNEIFTEEFFDEDENYTGRSKNSFFNKISEELNRKVADSIHRVVDESYKTAFNKLLKEKIVITNRVGQAETKPMTLKEFIVHCAESALEKKVDNQGRFQTEQGYSSFHADGKTYAIYLAEIVIMKEAKETLARIYKNIATEIGQSLFEKTRLDINQILAKVGKKLDHALVG